MVARSSSSVIPDRYRVMICCFLVTRCGRGAALFDDCASVLNIQRSSIAIGHRGVRASQQHNAPRQTGGAISRAQHLGDGPEFTTKMRNEGVEPFVVTDQATQPAPEPRQFEPPSVAGRLFI